VFSSEFHVPCHLSKSLTCSTPFSSRSHHPSICSLLPYVENPPLPASFARARALSLLSLSLSLSSAVLSLSALSKSDPEIYGASHPEQGIRSTVSSTFSNCHQRACQVSSNPLLPRHRCLSPPPSCPYACACLLFLTYCCLVLCSPSLLAICFSFVD